MKKIIILSLLFISLISFAQVPQGISYQAIALNTSGNPVVSSNVRLRLSVLDASSSGSVLYSETHLKTTNAQGLFNLVIGQGTVVSGVFNTINWALNTKFLKVEMDATGGTTYVLVGTTQLLSVPYALAADSLVTSAGEGITLVSPNGTPYQVTVNDSGQLSLPTSSVAITFPTNLYMYGTFNNFNATTSLLLGNYPSYSGGGSSDISPMAGFKYLTSGTELKFLSQNNSSSPIYGVNGSNQVNLNSNAYTVLNTGFYYILIKRLTPSNVMSYNISSIAPILNITNVATYNSTYNTVTNIFSFVINGVTSSNNSGFYFNFPYATNPSGFIPNYGDNLTDGTIEYNGSQIVFPNTTATPKNFRVDLTINFNGSGNYTITQIP